MLYFAFDNSTPPRNDPCALIKGAWTKSRRSTLLKKMYSKLEVEATSIESQVQ